MIVVKVELHSAITGIVTTLGELVIANDATGTHRKGNYRAVAVKKGRSRSLALSVSHGSPDVIRKTEIKDYSRLSRPIWDLVALALKGMNYG